MSDDREEFEKDLNADETSLDQEAWALDEANEDRGRRFTAAMERLDAEVAAHETPEPGISNPRFGDRLRRFEVDMAAVHGLIWPNLKRIAYLIDQDAKSQAVRLGAKRGREREHLRRQVEEAVERLRYTVETDDGPSDRLEAEPFLEEVARIFGERAESPARPRVVCLCGSTRFKDAFDEANYQETMAGRIVLSVGFFMHASGNRHGQDVGATPEQKARLDELHMRKIDMADEVLVLNMGGYIGESTSREIAYALAAGRPVRYLEPLINPEHEPTAEPQIFGEGGTDRRDAAAEQAEAVLRNIDADIDERVEAAEEMTKAWGWSTLGRAQSRRASRARAGRRSPGAVMGILSWARARRRRAERRDRLAAKIFEGLTRGGGPDGWTHEDCAQIADLLAEKQLDLSRERAVERWARWQLIRLSKAGA